LAVPSRRNEMNRIFFVAAVFCLVPATLQAAVPVLRADCPFSYSASQPDPFSYIQPTYTVQREGTKSKLQCRPSGDISFNDPAVSVSVYSTEEVNSFFTQVTNQMTSLKSSLQQALEDAVFKAAVQDDQLNRIENEIWKRLAARYRTEIETLHQQIEALKAKLQPLEPATPAAAKH
jgi:BMFP domain-containing protein YqiC